MKQSYKNWKSVTEADFVSLFIKTWFAYISTLREMFPEAYNRQGDKKYLNCYKEFYRKEGYKRFTVDDSITGPIEKLYKEGRKVIMEQYPEYYLWDFYHLNEDFKFSLRDIPPDKSDCLISGLKMYRIRGSKYSFVITGFIRAWGEYYKFPYLRNIRFEVPLKNILSDSERIVKDNPEISEQTFLSWLLDAIYSETANTLVESFNIVITAEENKRLQTKYQELLDRSKAMIRNIIILNGKDETLKTSDEMDIPRNMYEIIQQRPLNYYLYHTEVDWEPQDRPEEYEKRAHDDKWYKELSESLRRFSVLWFLDFIYRLRNALFHEIIDPLDEKWQIIFKNSYLVLKEIVDLNIATLETKRDIECDAGETSSSHL